MGKLPRRSCGSVPHPFGSQTSRLAQGWDLLLRFGRSLLTLRPNWASVESTASCSREVRLPLRRCRQLQRSSPFLCWFGRQQLAPGSCRCHRPTVIREPCHACHSTGTLLAISRLAGHHGPSGFVECITQSWWRAHHTQLAAKVSQLECLVVLFGPAAVFIGVFSIGRVLLQVINPSFTGAQPRRVSNQSAHVAKPFPLPLAFPPFFTLGFSMALPASSGCGHSWRLPATFFEVPCHWPPAEESWAIDFFYLFLCSCPSMQS